jgi:hypothetical protein
VRQDGGVHRDLARGRRGRGVLVALALALAAGGCTGAGPDAPEPDRSAEVSPAPGDLPPGVLDALRVEVRQNRTDRAARVVQLAVHNDGTTDLEVVAARLTSPTVVGPAVARDGRRVPGGTRRDVSVALGDPVCTGGSASGAPAVVHLEVADEAGRRGTLDVAAEDPNGHLARIHGADCAAVAVARGAVLGLAPGVATRQDPDGRWVGTVTLTVTPVAGGPEVVVDAVDATVLLAPAASGSAWAAGVSTAAGAAGGVALDLVPARCDPHAVAEDKRGTAFGVHARVDGVEQPVFHVTADDALRGLLHEFVALACGWPAS